MRCRKRKDNTYGGCRILLAIVSFWMIPASTTCLQPAVLSRSCCARKELGLSASVTDLFRILEEEEENNETPPQTNRYTEERRLDDGDDAANNNNNNYNNKNNNDDEKEDGSMQPTVDESDDDDDDDEYVVSDAEALLACWSFLKRRKRLGKWVEYEERQAQKALSRNYFLTDEEVGDELLSEILDDEEEEEEDDDAPSHYDDEDDDDEDWTASLTRIRDILLPSGPLGDDDYAFDDDEEDDDDDMDIDPIPFDSLVGGGDADLEDIYNNENFDEDDEDTPMITVQDLLLRGSPLDVDYKFDGGDSNDNSDDAVARDFKLISSLISDDDDDGPVTPPETTEEIDLWYTEFTSFPTEPSDSRMRRVNAMKRRWENPDYRERWYEKRWGNRKRKREIQTDQERTAIQRARALPSGFLGSEELASLTEEEIAEAIRMRIESTHKRVNRRNQTLRDRREVLAKQMKTLETSSENDETTTDDLRNLSRDALYAPDTHQLVEAQKQRSERAKKLYATRRKNEELRNEEGSSSFESSQKKKPPKSPNPYFPPKQLTPRDAFLRIENDLDGGVTPSPEDLRLVMEPGRMKDRKGLLGRILLEEFGLRGKCVPIAASNGDGDNDDDLQFVQRCTVEQLGTFCISLLENTRRRRPKPA